MVSSSAVLPALLRTSAQRVWSVTACRCSTSVVSKEPATSGVGRLPRQTRQVKPMNDLTFDKVTHTGQAWDDDDIRLARFTNATKLVNPNIAMHLIAQVPPKACKERVVSCDGGGGALGHPKVYINLDKPGNHACGYCGLRFYKESVEHDGTEHIQV